MSNERLKLVVSNPDTEPKKPEADSEVTPMARKTRNFFYGLFYFFWIMSIPSAVAIASALALGAMAFTVEIMVAIAGPAFLVLIFGFFLFVVNKTQPSYDDYIQK